MQAGSCAVHKQLVGDTSNGAHPKRRKKADAAKRKLKTIAGRLVRELEHKLPDTACATGLEILKKVLGQERNGKDKIYSLHEPEVYCMSKGKANKKYEFGRKASVVLTQKDRHHRRGDDNIQDQCIRWPYLGRCLDPDQGLTGKVLKYCTIFQG